MPEGDPIRIIPHRGVDDDCGSLEVWFADESPAVRFYWDNQVSRRLDPHTLTREQAIEKATALARAEIDKLDNPACESPGTTVPWCAGWPSIRYSGSAATPNGRRKRRISGLRNLLTEFASNRRGRVRGGG
jgi:hypothetical protein